jgi:pilus assembly protein CpaE
MAIPEERITVVVNRHDKKTALETQDICRTVGVENHELVLLPNDYRDVAQSVNIGVPMLDHSRSSAVTKALMKLESRLTGVAASAAQTGLFSKAFSTLIRS